MLQKVICNFYIDGIVVTYKYLRPWVIDNYNLIKEGQGIICINIDDNLKAQVAKLAEKYSEKVNFWYTNYTYFWWKMDYLRIPPNKTTCVYYVSY